MFYSYKVYSMILIEAHYLANEIFHRRDWSKNDQTQNHMAFKDFKDNPSRQLLFQKTGTNMSFWLLSVNVTAGFYL